MSIRHADHKPTGLDWRQTARAIHRTKGKRLTRPDRTDVVTRTIVVTKGIVHVEATRRKSHHSNIIVFYKLNSAIERGTKPDAWGWNPCHCTSTLKAAMVGDVSV